MVMIDIEMPEDCIDCPIQHTEFGWCKLNPGMDWYGFDGRPEWCPLIEVNDNDQN